MKNEEIIAGGVVLKANLTVVYQQALALMREFEAKGVTDACGYLMAKTVVEGLQRVAGSRCPFCGPLKEMNVDEKLPS